MNELTKKEAIALLEVSEKTLERYTKRGDLSIKYVKGKRGKEARYSRTELEQLIADRDTPTYKPIVISEPNEKPSDVLMVPENAPSIINSLGLLIEAIRNPPAPAIPLRDKLVLTIPEAQQLTGLGKKTLKGAINCGTLKARKVGGSWRIRQDDLKEYVNVLFEKVAF